MYPMRSRFALALLASCTASGGQKLATACSPNSIISSDSTLFWHEACDGTVRSFANGATNPEIIATGQPRSQSFAVDAANLYWLTYTTDTTADVRSMAKTGGTITTLATGEASPCTVPRRLVVDDTNVYWLAAGGLLRTTLTTGGPVTTIATKEGLSTPTVAADDPDWLYWSEGASLFRRSKADGTIDTIVEDPSTDAFPIDLVATHGSLYYRVYRNAGEGSVEMYSVRAQPDSKPVPLPIDSTAGYSTSMVLSGDRLLWIEHDAVVSMSLDGTDTHDVASLAEGEDATSLAADASYVYWTDTREPGAVMRARL